MSRYTAIDLSQLAAPTVVEPLSYAAIKAALVADLVARDPAFSALLESDPAIKVLEVAAARELLLRQRVNNAAQAVMLAYATGTDLEHLAAIFGTARLSDETDSALRTRTQMALEGFTTAGSSGAYEYHALSASSAVKDVSVRMPDPGEVEVRVLATAGTGLADNALLATVQAALTADEVRPLTDTVTVLSAVIVPYTVQAALTLYAGPDAEVVRGAAQSAVTTLTAALHALGRDVTRSALFAALHQSGVQNVSLTAPTADVVCGVTQAAYCTAITVTIAGTATE